ncbi:MAG: isochorismatase [Phototrophicaceae bacterium]
MSYADYYTPERIGKLYRPEIDAASRAGLAAGISSSDDDQQRTYLLLIDIQADFCHPDGALFIPGAPDDVRRTVEFIYNNAASITKIGATLDTHLPIQIFHPPWWVDADGNHPDPYTPISSEDVKNGKWSAVYEPEWSLTYTEQLEEQAKKQLMIWPFHVLLGTPGQTLVPALSEAIAYHAAARRAQPDYVVKGLIPKSEFYSAIEPDVKVPEHPQGDVNRELLDDIASYDRIYIAGQAKSHCLLETVASMMRHYDEDIISKIRVLEDTMSPVAHPEIDFDAMADEQFARFQEAGLKLTTTDAALA